MNDQKRVDNQIVELRRKLKKASARRAGLKYIAERNADERAQQALRASAQNT